MYIFSLSLFLKSIDKLLTIIQYIHFILVKICLFCFFILFSRLSIWLCVSVSLLALWLAVLEPGGLLEPFSYCKMNNWISSNFIRISWTGNGLILVPFVCGIRIEPHGAPPKRNKHTEEKQSFHWQRKRQIPRSEKKNPTCAFQKQHVKHNQVIMN